MTRRAREASGHASFDFFFPAWLSATDLYRRPTGHGHVALAALWPFALASALLPAAVRRTTIVASSPRERVRALGEHHCLLLSLLLALDRDLLRSAIAPGRDMRRRSAPAPMPDTTMLSNATSRHRDGRRRCSFATRGPGAVSGRDRARERMPLIGGLQRVGRPGLSGYHRAIAQPLVDEVGGFVRPGCPASRSATSPAIAVPVRVGSGGACRGRSGTLRAGFR